MTEVRIVGFSKPIDPTRVIVKMIEVTCDDTLTSCPHCGATGKTVWHFVCADGEKRGAMRGCMNKFIMTAGAIEARKWHEKLKKYPGWRKALNEIERYNAMGEEIIVQVQKQLEESK